ncbi:MAG TPA: acyl-CoA dehydrogenase family protein [Rhizomicrobium sp.]
MDIRFSQADLDFAEDVRVWVRAAYPAEMRKAVAASPHGRIGRDEHVWWQRQLLAKNWLVPHWPAMWGGGDWPPARLHLFRLVLADENTPDFAGAGVELLAPVLLRHGSEAQRRRYIPNILDASHWWCQGYSEPGAGSDLAAVALRAKRSGGRYVLNGTKLWTTGAHKADHIFVLARTDAGSSGRQGLSFLLVDMRQGGVRVEPIITLDGAPSGDHEVNQVFFDDTVVPVEDLVGEEGQGWICARSALEAERTTQSSPHVKRALAELRRAVGDDPALRRRAVMLEIDCLALEWTELRCLAGQPPMGAASILRCAGGRLEQLAEAALYDSDGERGMIGLDARGDAVCGHGPRYLNGRKRTIYGGTVEIQRNIIAKQCLGL